MKNHVYVVAIAAIAGVFLSQCTFAGQLSPPGPPTSGTMKPLSEIEPRTPIRQADIPLTISTPGSYYLTEDVTATQSAITLATDHVTIDLCGYSVIGTGSAFAGFFASGHGNAEVRNGTIRGFDRGVSATYENDKNLRFINLRVLACSGEGIYCLGSNVLVENCLVSGCGSSTSSETYGINVGPDSTVLNCQVTDIGTLQTGGYATGIHTHRNCRVSGNTVTYVGTAALYAYGIRTWPYCIVTGNTVGATGTYGICAENGNTISGNLVSQNGENGGSVYGIWGGSGCIVSDNNSSVNGLNAAYFNGIMSGSGSLISNNSACNNGNSSGGGYGLYGGSGSRVVGNTCSGNGSLATGSVYGLYVGSNCLVDQNVSYNNSGTNMNQSSSCTYGTNHAP